MSYKLKITAILHFFLFPLWVYDHHSHYGLITNHSRAITAPLAPLQTTKVSWYFFAFNSVGNSDVCVSSISWRFPTELDRVTKAWIDLEVRLGIKIKLSLQLSTELLRPSPPTFPTTALVNSAEINHFRFSSRCKLAFPIPWFMVLTIYDMFGGFWYLSFTTNCSLMTSY